MIISFISQKGGVGKSALARLIAVEFARQGWSVKIGDLDTGQGSTVNWKSRRDMNDIKPEIPAEKYATVDRAIKDAQNFDLMILDGPAFAEQGGLVMAKASDLVILPSGYSLDDMPPQVETAQDLEKSGVAIAKVVFVFSRADASEAEDRDARAYLKRAGVSVLDHVLPERPSIRQAHNNGKAASEVSAKSVRDKVLLLAQEIANKLTKKQEG